MLSEPFHIRLQSLMASRKLTQSELARRMGVGRVCVNYWYWGINEPSIGTLRRMRDVLKCSWEELLGE